MIFNITHVSFFLHFLGNQTECFRERGFTGRAGEKEKDGVREAIVMFSLFLTLCSVICLLLALDDPPRIIN